LYRITSLKKQALYKYKTYSHTSIYSSQVMFISPSPSFDRDKFYFLHTRYYGQIWLRRVLKYMWHFPHNGCFVYAYLFLFFNINLYFPQITRCVLPPSLVSYATGVTTSHMNVVATLWVLISGAS